MEPVVSEAAYAEPARLSHLYRQQDQPRVAWTEPELRLLSGPVRHDGSLHPAVRDRELHLRSLQLSLGQEREGYNRGGVECERTACPDHDPSVLWSATRRRTDVR